MGAKINWDFSGYATKNDVRCSDGRIIRRDAFKDQHGKIVPIVWQHSHDDPTNVVGHGLLENREDGVYLYGSFNESQKALAAKEAVRHKDVTSMSIYANKLTQSSDGEVFHGIIREVSLVLAGANPEALIDRPILMHGEAADDDATIFFNQPLILSHSDEEESVKDPEEEESLEDTNTESQEETKEVEHSEEIEDQSNMNENKTVQDVLDGMSEDEKNVIAYLVGEALDSASVEHSDEENGGNEEMSHNVFDKSNKEEDVLCQTALNNILAESKKGHSLKDTFLAHAEEYGIENIGYMFPDAKATSNTPDMIKRDDSWVSRFMSRVHHTPFSRIKSIHADITAEEARAKGYIKGNLKMEEVITLLKRQTLPTTIYKKQKLDRDDVIDITDFDVVSWLKTEMRMMLNEEIARACLISDGRSTASDDKINEMNVRPIWTDSDLYTVKAVFNVAANASEDDIAKAFIRAVIKSRKNYKGSGNPDLFTTEDMVTNCLLLEDTIGHPLYDTMEKLRTKLRVNEIVTVPVMENQTREVSGVVHHLDGIIVNPVDYNIGADKGGSINMFDDFDIDYNQMKYLIETRISGALTKPYSAIAVEHTVSA